MYYLICWRWVLKSTNCALDLTFAASLLFKPSVIWFTSYWSLCVTIVTCSPSHSPKSTLVHAGNLFCFVAFKCANTFDRSISVSGDFFPKSNGLGLPYQAHIWVI
jgi:hypothetical protein